MRILFAIVSVVYVLITPRVSSSQALPLEEPVLSDDHFDSLQAYMQDAVQQEINSTDIPSIAVVLVTREGIVLELYEGFEDEARSIAASPRTVFRMGSISKMLTGVLTMIAAEEGLLDLDIPVATYVEELEVSPLSQTITLRQLLSHQAGLVREPPIGNYLDPSEPDLRATVASLIHADFVYSPGEKIKYSNAGYGLIGLALENVYNMPFSDIVQVKLFDRVDMRQSWSSRFAFPENRLGYARMWDWKGEQYAPPLFDFGMAPAGFLYATAPDLGKFLTMLLREGDFGGEQVIRAGDLDEMWSPQTSDHAAHWNRPCNGDCTAGAMEVGLAANLNRPFEGYTLVRHGGGVYGYSSELAFLPEAGIGVIVVNTLDSMGRVSRQLATAALRAYIKSIKGEPIPDYELASSVMRQVHDNVGAAREEASTPGRSSVGFYGNVKNGLEIIDEQEEELVVLIEGVDLVRLPRAGIDAFTFPRFSSYGGESLTFKRSQEGELVGVLIGAGDTKMLLEAVK